MPHSKARKATLAASFNPSLPKLRAIKTTTTTATNTVIIDHLLANQGPDNPTPDLLPPGVQDSHPTHLGYDFCEL
jgi:hypothetical protein